MTEASRTTVRQERNLAVLQPKRIGDAGSSLVFGYFYNLAFAKVISAADRITIDEVNEEISRLKQGWGSRFTATCADELTSFLTEEQIEGIDLFDRVQLAEVIRVCQTSKSLSAAGRTLFQASRKAKAKPNDADRLRKYLAKFGLSWTDLQT